MSRQRRQLKGCKVKICRKAHSRGGATSLICTEVAHLRYDATDFSTNMFFWQNLTISERAQIAQGQIETKCKCLNKQAHVVIFLTSRNQIMFPICKNFSRSGVDCNLLRRRVEKETQIRRRRCSEALKWFHLILHFLHWVLENYPHLTCFQGTQLTQWQE